MSGTYQELGTEIGELVDRKNAAYGSSFHKCGDFLRLLYPRGIEPNEMENALLLVRIFDKQMRIATDQDAFGESPFQDIAGYGLLGAMLQREKQEQWQGSVNGPDVEQSSKAQPASAEQLIRQPITTSEKSSAAPATSQPPESSSPQPTDATASIAAVIASPSEVALLDRVQSRNREGSCGICTTTRSETWYRISVRDETFTFCCHECRKDFISNLNSAASVVVA